MRVRRKIIGAVVAVSIAIGAIPLTETPTKAMEDSGAVTPSTAVKTIMRGTTGINRQTTTENAGKYICEKGSSIFYGSYPQEFISEETPAKGTENVDWVHIIKVIKGEKPNTEDKGYYSIDPIEWRVLANDSTDGLFLLSEKNLDVVQYDRNYTEKWSTSEIRGWLNNGANNSTNPYEDSFIGRAFTTKEGESIPGTDIDTGENVDYFDHAYDTDKTTDKIFLLSVGEVTGKGKDYLTQEDVTYDYGFKKSHVTGSESDYKYNATENHEALNTDYVQNGCGKTGNTPYNSGGPVGTGRWWLRSPGDDGWDAAIVDSDGAVSRYGYRVNDFLRGGSSRF